MNKLALISFVLIVYILMRIIMLKHSFTDFICCNKQYQININAISCSK